MTADVTGTLGTTPFTDALLTVTSVADTSNVFVAGGYTGPVYEVIASSSTVSIAGVTNPGSLPTFTDTTFWLDVQPVGDIIFGDASGGPGFGCVPTGCAILGFSNFLSGPPYLTFYHLDSSIGPISGEDFPVAVFDAFENIPTSGGLLSVPKASNTVEVNGVITEDFTETFTAVAAVPEPTPFVLLGSLAFFGLIRFQKKRQALPPPRAGGSEVVALSAHHRFSIPKDYYPSQSLKPPKGYAGTENLPSPSNLLGLGFWGSIHPLP